MTFTRNGELVDTGAGAAALGDPLAVVAWLANVLASAGVALEPGHLIMTGALHAAVPMTPGDVFRAEFDRLGPSRSASEDENDRRHGTTSWPASDQGRSPTARRSAALRRVTDPTCTGYAVQRGCARARARRSAGSSA